MVFYSFLPAQNYFFARTDSGKEIILLRIKDREKIVAIKVMVVDDELEMIEFIKTGLEPFGYEIINTNDALEAIQLAHDVLPDLIVLDYMMPGIDGYSIYKGLNVSKITRDIPVIFITGYMTPQITAKILQTKAFCYLAKPFDIDDLMDRINDALATKSLETSFKNKNAAKAD
jgi:CheY-like chemotaxis protein